MRYVLFNYPDGGFWGTTKDGYYRICLEELIGEDNVTIVNYPLDSFNFFVKLLYKFTLHYCSKYKHFRISNIILSWWYPYYFKTQKDAEQYCFVFISKSPDINYIRYLRKTFPNCKIVMAYRDLVCTKPRYQELKDTGFVDLWMSYDKGDCEKYGMTNFSQFESRVYVSESNSTPRSDVFFLGRAKNRLPELLKAYDHLTSLGLKCLFIILSAKINEIQQRDGIIYIDKPMSYRKMLEYSVNSKCILDINQEGAVGFTSRFLEAVIYNKLLLTNCKDVCKHPVYNKQLIFCFDDITNVDAAFFIDKEGISYNYHDEFSPKHFLQIIKNKLNEI